MSRDTIVIRKYKNLHYVLYYIMYLYLLLLVNKKGAIDIFEFAICFTLQFLYANSDPYSASPAKNILPMLRKLIEDSGWSIFRRLIPLW